MVSPIAFLVFFCAFCCVATGGEAPRSLAPHPQGTRVSTTITYGDAYSTPIEIYDSWITVSEVWRGEKALSLLAQEGEENRPLPSGFEYLAVKIRFEFAARGKPGNKEYVLGNNQFAVFSANGSTQYSVADAALRNPGLRRTLRSGDVSEGWVVFIVSTADRKPFMVFHADVQMLSHTGTGPAFRLY